MESRTLEFRKQDSASRTFQHRLRLLKESMKDCYIFETSTYTLHGTKRQRHTTLAAPYDPYPQDPLHVTALDEYCWLRKSKSDTFYGLGRFRDHYVSFSFRYDDLKESSKLKLTYATTREALIEHAMSPRIYRRYLKETSS